MSKYRREEAPSLPKHKHCRYCGAPVDMSKDFCSDKCRMEHRRASRGRTRNFILITAVVLIFYLILIFRL